MKNLNSLKAVSGAIEFEVERQIDILESGGVVENVTRGYDTNAKQTVPMRDKEVKQDYRFMPEPNLPPLHLTDNNVDSANPNVLNVAKYREEVPSLLPKEKRKTLMEKFQLPIGKAGSFICPLFFSSAWNTFYSKRDRSSAFVSFR